MIGFWHTKSRKITIQREVMAMVVIVFLLMFSVLDIVFYRSMTSLLSDREADSIENQVRLAEGVLRSSNEYLATVITDWAAWDNTYDFMKGSFDELSHYNLTDFLYTNYALDFVTLLDVDGKPVFERFYPNEANDLKVVNLLKTYAKLGPMTVATYTNDDEADGAINRMGINGFLRADGQLLYLCAYPILRTDQTGPCMGTMIFGRTIERDQIDFLRGNTETIFSVRNRGEMTLPEWQSFANLKDQTIVEVGGENLLTASRLLGDIYGESDLVLSLSAPRHLYREGAKFIRDMLLYIALFCAGTLFAILMFLRAIVVKPLSNLVQEVNGINMDTIHPLSQAAQISSEFVILVNAVNDLLRRIKTNRDVIHKNNEALYYTANYDALTGLRNRGNLCNALDGVIRESRQFHTYAGVFFIDLDRFKFINDALGHSAGDLFIVAVTERLRNGLPSAPIVGRIEGDTFAVIAHGFTETNEVYLYADRIMSMFEEPFVVKDRQMNITASMGTSIYPHDAGDAETLFKNAEMAMYRAKELGRNMSCRYEIELFKVFKYKLFVENSISAAINDGCRPFQMYYQPKVLTHTGQILSCEALIRWVTPKGIISPSDFIPLAEESGLIVPISQWVLSQAFQCGMRLKAQGIDHVISVNISAQVLLHADFLNMVRSAAAEWGADTHMLDIEITEATLIEDIRQINLVLDGLHRMGITISIDDFGTGYSSLSYLKQLLIDRIKIDRSFIVGINDNDEDRTIVDAIMAMAKSLHLIVTTEGVEDVEQYEYLKDIGCDEVQGYYISRPIPYDEYVRFVKKNTKIYHHPMRNKKTG